MRLTLTIVLIVLITGLFSCQTEQKTKQGEIPLMITTGVPERPAGQENVLQLKTDPIPNVKVAFIGLGMRGPGAVKRLAQIDGVEVVALCDIREERVKSANQMLQDLGQPQAQEFYGDTAVWKKVTKLPNVDLVYIATDWKNHARMGVKAMKDGKHVAIEVPAAMTMDEIWALINTSEQTRKHCMQLEIAFTTFSN